MQVQNLLIYSSAIADASSNGPWIDISNLVSLSVQINAYTAATTDIEVSNDPNVMIDGAGIGVPGSAPTLSQTNGGAAFQSGVSNLPALTYFVKTTFITKWGETTPSAQASLAVSAGNALVVQTAAPSAAQAPFVIGWNVYISLTTNTETLQTMPPFTPQRLTDGIGTVGGTVTSLGTGQSTHYAISGALPIGNTIYTLINGLQPSNVLVPSVDNSGGTGTGISVSNGNGVDTLSSDTNQTVAVFLSPKTTPVNLMWTPSCMTWKFLRVTHGGASTVAYLNGQRG